MSELPAASGGFSFAMKESLRWTLTQTQSIFPPFYWSNGLERKC